ncbi:Glycosyltransferase involved in cell wall bisynthesis [Thiohalorhabdus denitrificans]|uniref:Glycosyltransferase involved in cell wall bisynthesis n=3 Tax=Thiohalorhabdus denitrificans TaxID=381306 RepID=A0A1G5AN36_9GAMM|nr:Glycosyltransferase involved in cell wall bisynthesis [Thiohalorhabdus denitrificans]
MEPLSSPSPAPGTRVLFIRPGNGNSRQLFAMDHYARAAQFAGMGVGILGPVPDHPEADRLTALGSFPSFRPSSPWSLVTRLRAFHAAVRDFQPDLVHVRSHLGGGLLPGLRRLLSPRTKMILDIRTMAPNTHKHRLARALRSVNGKGYDHVFALNQPILDAYIGSGVETSLLPLGFDDGLFRPGMDNVQYEPGCRLRCIYYGSMNGVRGLETLLQGLVRALQAGVDLEANLVGEGDDKQRLVSLVPPAYADRIRFHPFSGQQALAATLREHHLGLAYVPQQPVFDPNLPLKTVEMLASGLPVLATRTRGNRQVVQEGVGGIFVEDDPQVICEGLIQAARGAGAMAAQPHERASTVRDYAWSGLAKAYLFPIYAALLND